jgi:hypothetical protein
MHAPTFIGRFPSPITVVAPPILPYAARGQISTLSRASSRMRRVPADQVYHAKPASNLFLTAAGWLELEIESAIAVGDCA